MFDVDVVSGGDVDEAIRLRSAGVSVPGFTAWAPAGTRCSFCNAVALVDGKQRFSERWGYMCPQHYRRYGLCLGEGFGQVLLQNIAGHSEAEGQWRG